MSTAISVVVPVHNGRELVVGCLGSVPSDVELIVVDDASTDGAPDLIRERFPAAVMLRNEANLGFAATANRGLAAATRPIRLVLNSDARLRPGALAALVQAFERSDVGVAGPRLVFPDGSHQTSAASFPTVVSFVTGSFAVNEVFRRLFPDRRFRWELGMARRDHDRDHDVDWVMGTALAIHERCLDDVGGFDEGYRMYVEECDLCWRASDAGWTVCYVADAVVEHLGGGSGGDPVRQARFNVLGEARFMARAHGPSALRHWRLARGVSSAVKAALFSVGGLASERLADRARWHRSAVKTVRSLDLASTGLDAGVVIEPRRDP